MQVFNLSILPGTAFRQEAAELGLTFQPRPPYYVLHTPTLAREDLFGLMQEAEDLFGIEFDAQPPPVLSFDETGPILPMCRVDLDRTPAQPLQGVDRWAQAFTIWLQSADFRATATRSGSSRTRTNCSCFSTMTACQADMLTIAPNGSWYRPFTLYLIRRRSM